MKLIILIAILTLIGCGSENEPGSENDSRCFCENSRGNYYYEVNCFRLGSDSGATTVDEFNKIDTGESCTTDEYHNQKWFDNSGLKYFYITFDDITCYSQIHYPHPNATGYTTFVNDGGPLCDSVGNKNAILNLGPKQ